MKDANKILHSAAIDDSIANKKADIVKRLKNCSMCFGGRYQMEFRFLKSYAVYWMEQIACSYQLTAICVLLPSISLR